MSAKTKYLVTWKRSNLNAKETNIVSITTVAKTHSKLDAEILSSEDLIGELGLELKRLFTCETITQW